MYCTHVISAARQICTHCKYSIQGSIVKPCNTDRKRTHDDEERAEHDTTIYTIKIKLHSSSCEIEDFVETRLCLQAVVCDTPIARITGVCVLIKDFFFFFSHFYFPALLDKPWSQVSSLLPAGPCLQFLSRIGFSNPTARRFFIECC